MKKFFLPILFCFLVIIISSCEQENSLPNMQIIATIPTATLSENTSSINQTELDTAFSITINIEGSRIEDNRIIFSVHKDVSSYSFINAFTIPSQYKWELHWDKECLSSLNIASKTVDLIEGDNLLYALFINKNNPEDVYFYEIHASRECPTTEDIVNQALMELTTYTQSHFNNYPDDYLSPLNLREHLEHVMGYNEEIAISAIDRLAIDWTKQAKIYIQPYLTYEAEFGYAATWIYPFDIEEMLYTEEFSCEIIEEVMMDIDWSIQASKYLKHISDFDDTLTRVRARGILEEIAANEAGVNYILENSNIDWEQHAYNYAKSMLQSYPYPLDELRYELLNYYDFTDEEVQYAIDRLY